MTKIFPQVNEWFKKGKPDLYTPGTLFEYINGAAEVFLSYDFQQLATQTYENKNKHSITVDVYLHSNPTNGFGIYSAEKPEKGDFLKIGTQGYYEKGILNFLKGSFYIKISGYDLGDNDRSILISIAKMVGDQLHGKPIVPKLVNCFPPDGKIKNSEKFILKNFMGYKSLSSAFVTSYSSASQTFKLFIISGKDKTNSEQILKGYLKSIKYPSEKLKEGEMSIKDPYHGEIDLLWKGKFIGGVTGLTDAKLRAKYLNLLKNNLEKI